MPCSSATSPEAAISASKPFVRQWQKHWRLQPSRRQGDAGIVAVALGYDVGNARPGWIGYTTRLPIGLSQAPKPRPATCFPHDASLLREIR